MKNGDNFMKNKQISIKISDYFQINKPNYTYLKLIPNTSVKNNKACNIAEIINNVYVEINERFKRKNKGFSYDLPSKVMFIIDINKYNADFYLVIPSIHVKEFNQKLTEVFGKITIEEVDNIKGISSDCTKYSLSYAKDDSLSLCVDKRDNDLLSANLSVMDVMQDDDRVVILYNFIPQSKIALNAWKQYHINMMKQYQEGKSLDKSLTFNKVLIYIGTLLFDTIDVMTNSLRWFFGQNESNEDLMKRFIPVQELTKETRKKENAKILKTQIMICSESNSLSREKENAKTMINTFGVVGNNADNKLVAKEIKNGTLKKSIGIKKKHTLSKEKNKTKEKTEYINLEKLSLENEICKMSYDEVGANFIALPGRTIIEDHKLEAIQHNETIIPEELQGGNVRYGTNVYRGHTTTVTTSRDEDANCMPVVVMAKMGGGKSTFFENNGVDAIKNGEGLIVIDFIKNCELSNNIIRNIPKEKVITIDFSDYSCKEGFSFNEINMIRDMSIPMSRYECAGLQSSLITQFIDSLGDEEFSANMGRYIDAACSAVLIHEDKSIIDIVRCLENYKVRSEYMQKLEEFKEMIPDEYRELIEDDLTALEELNEYREIKVNNKKTGEVEICGTNTTKISGILSRISQLKKNPSLKFMYARKPNNNINLTKLMQEGKAIFFKLPQDKFSSVTSKNVMVSYLFSKIEMAGIVRAKVYEGEKLTTVNVICDEIHQSKDSFNNIYRISTELRKFRTKLILSTHGFHKIYPIKDTLIEAGSSIIMLRGSSTKNFEIMEDEFKKFGFTKEDLVSLSHTDKYKALCLIATKKGRHGCIVELPKPVKNKIELQNIIDVDFNTKEKIS